MPVCAVITCRARSAQSRKENERISFHRFPKEPDLKEKWISATCRGDNWFPTKLSTICSKHFRESDFMKKKSGNRYLKPGAVPSHLIPSLGNLTPKREPVPTTSFAREGEEQMLQPDIPSGSSSTVSTPRKRKLKEIIATKENIIQAQRKQIKRIQAQQNRRLKKKITRVEDVLKDLERKFIMRHEDLNTLKHTNLQVEELIARHTAKTNSNEVSKQQYSPYSPALRTFALTLHYYSPKAYQYVRNTFNTCLPHVRTLRTWYSRVNGEPGFTSEAFEALKVKVESTKYPIVAGLVVDEMAIRRRIEWDGNKLCGHVEIGNGLDSDYVTEAKEALVFLVTGINCNFKVPVAYYLVDGVSGEQRASLVNICLEKLHDTGVKIVSLTFDGCASNLSMLDILGGSLQEGNVTFEHPVTKSQVAAILDPSHMIKLIRNAFQMYKTLTDAEGNKIKWDYLEELNSLQESEKFHLANKLRGRHIRFHNQKMKVMLATQLFSLSVADAINFCADDLKLPYFSESGATANFLRIINNLFDIFNSRNMYQHNFKRPINKNNAHNIFKFLEEGISYISQLKIDNGTLLIKSPRKVGFLGFIGCAIAIKHFYKSLIETQELIYFPFYKISQDHLEHFFGNIRSHGGANNNPTARQFKAAYKKILIHIELKDCGTGNCTALENLTILNCSSAVERINVTTDIDRCDPENDEEKRFIDDVAPYEVSELSAQVISHIAGNVAYSLIKILKCYICISALLTSNITSLHKFIIAKDKGGLLYPSNDVVLICKTAESVIRRYTDNLKKINKHALLTDIVKNFVGTKVFDEISYHQVNEFPASNHITDLIKAVAEKYVSIRLHFILKTTVRKETKRQLLTKYILFQGQ